MRSIVLPLFLLVAACGPGDDGYVKAAGEECQRILDEQLPEIQAQAWEECTTYYEEKVLPAAQDLFAKAIAELQLWFTWQLESLEENLLTALGCVANPKSPAGWDCSGSAICRP